MAKILYGKPVAEALNERVSVMAADLISQNIIPCLAVVRVGEDPGDLAYERSLIKKCTDLGIEVAVKVFETSVTEDLLIDHVRQINADASVHGCLIFRPLPKHLNETLICEALAPEKDVDGITQGSLTGIFTGAKQGFAPCTAQACIELLDHYQIPIEGTAIAVLGRSLVVGKPLSMMLLERNATVTICHSKTADLSQTLRNAQVVISAVGKAATLGSENIFPDQILLDVGINFNNEGKMVGDIDRAAAEKTAAALTPVPGGIGAVTTSVLALHVVEAAANMQNE